MAWVSINAEEATGVAPFYFKGVRSGVAARCVAIELRGNCLFYPP
jgi:hypothetical protein